MKIPETLEQYRYRSKGPWGSDTGDDYGAFNFPGPCGQDLRVIASPGNAHEDVPWEHVSVSTRNRCPNWKEMCFVKDLFWDPEEAVMQLHPPRSTWVNHHEFCLHLWKPMRCEIPLPPAEAVGPVAIGAARQKAGK